jgi:hypothetical protein
MIFILAFMARALPHLLKLLAEKAKATRENEWNDGIRILQDVCSFITADAANHAQPNWLNNPVKLASRACLPRSRW